MVDIKWIGSPNFRSANARKEGFILHWMAGYLPGTDSLFQSTSNGVATHYGIGSRDGRGNGLEVHQYVADKDRSYGSYNGDADTRGLSIEIENDIHLPYPGKPTPEVHELVARFMAQKAIEHDMRIDGELKLVLGDFPDHRFYERSIPQFGRDFNVTTHRSMALKDCPGTTDVQWLVARANQIISGGAASDLGDDMYDANAQIALFGKIESEARPLKLYQYGSGFIIVGPGGKDWAIPSSAYHELLKALGLTAAFPQRVINEAELGFVKQTLSLLAPDPILEQTVHNVISLSPEDADRLAASVSESALALSEKHADRIAALVAEKVGVTKDQIVEALKSVTYKAS